MKRLAKLFLAVIGIIAFHAFALIPTSIEAQNTPIEAVPDTVTTSINEAVSFNVLQNDIGENINVHLALQPSHGTLAWKVNGDFTYTPNENYVGPDVLVYQIEDDEGNAASGNVFITVEGMPNLPLQVSILQDCLNSHTTGVYSVTAQVFGGIPPYTVDFLYGDDLLNLGIHTEISLEYEFMFWVVELHAGYAISIRDAADNVLVENHLQEIFCHEDVVNTCILETDFELTPSISCNEGEKNIEVVATGGSGDYTFYGQLLTNGDYLVVEDSEGCQNILFYDEVPEYTCPIAVDDVVNGAYNAPFHLKPLLNDIGDGLYISDISGLKHGTIQWRPDNFLAYYPNEDFAGIDTLEYEITDPMGNSSRATILAVVPENDEVTIFWERDCTRTEETGIYTINFTVAGGKPPYIIDGDFLTNEYRGDEILSFIKADGESFSITAIDKDNTTTSLEPDLIPCIFLPYPESDFTVYISCVEGEDYGILTALEPFGELLQDNFEGNNHGDTIPNGSIYSAFFPDYNVPAFEGIVYCPPMAEDDLYESHPSYLQLPFTFNPLLNDKGHGLKLVNIESPNYGTLDEWEAEGTLTYRPNTDFQGVDTFDYTLEDIGGNRTTATIKIVLAHPTELHITYERDCFEVNNNGAENYTVNAFVSGGKPPYQVQVNEGSFFEVTENGGAFSFEIPNGEGFEIYAEDSGSPIVHIAMVEELEMEACSPLIVQVERDCGNMYETGKYQLGVYITGGTPPYIISGSIDTILEQSGAIFTQINDGTPYEITVIDSADVDFFEEGGEVACTGQYHCASQYIEILYPEEIITCTCDGSLVFSLENFEFDLPIEKVWGFWINENQEEIYLNAEGDTIPASVYFEINGVRGEDWCQRFSFNGESGISGNVSDFCTPDSLEAIDDFANTQPGEPVTVNVLANDTGTNLQIGGIIVSPSCGEIVDINPETGDMVYVADADTDCFVDIFYYEVIDECGNVEVAIVTIFIESEESELIVQVERDCTLACETGSYTLNVLVQGGTPPYFVSGSINDTLQTSGFLSTELENGQPYEIYVVDADGSEFYDVGGDIACTGHCCSYIETESIEGISDCLCDGSFVFTLETDTITAIFGEWTDGNQYYSIEIGDTIPSDGYITYYEFYSNGTCYTPIYDGEYSSGNVSDFCTLESYTIEAIDDFANTHPGEPVTINVLANDTGTNLQISGLLLSPSCGEIVDINPETGAILYVPDADTDCNIDTFVYEVVDECGNVTASTVIIFIEQENDLLVQTEVDCIVEDTGLHVLNILVAGGTPPYTISGSINETLEQEGVTFTLIEACTTFEVQVVDAEGNQFNETRYPLCYPLCSNIVLDEEQVVQQGYLECLCDGALVVNLAPLFKDEDEKSIEGFWSLDNQTYPIAVGDTIPANAYFEISSVQINFYNFNISTLENDFLGGYTSEFCTSDTIEAIDDFASVNVPFSTTINVLQNDTGTNILINQIITPPTCGEILEVNPEEGTITYLAEPNSSCSFDSIVYEVIDECGNLAEASVTIFIIDETYILVTVERDCEEVENTGYYTLNINVQGGYPPYIITGTFDATLETDGIISFIHENGLPYELLITDSIGSQYYDINSEFPCLEAKTDLTTTNSTESITFNVLENDLGEGIFVHEITKQPICGQVEIINAELGTVQYTPDIGCLLGIVSFEYEIEDVESNRAVTKVKIVINRNENKLAVGIETDCTNAENTGIYTLTVAIADGIAPFTISGSINETLENIGEISTIITDGIEYNITVIDAAGNELSQTGAEAACNTFGPQIRFYHIDEIGSCICDGGLIVDFGGLWLEPNETIDSIDGYWIDENGNQMEVELGDTIPSGHFFQLERIYTYDDELGYRLTTRDTRNYPQGFTSDFCTSQQQPPIPTLNESQSQTMLCGEGNIILNLEDGEEGTVYNWYLDAALTIPANPPTGQVWTNDEIVGARIIYAVATDTSGCQSESLAISTYHYHELEVINFEITIDESCENYQVTFVIVGGNELYTVNGQTAFHIVTRPWQPIEEDYSFTIDDNPLIPNCEPVVITGSVDTTDCCIGGTLEITPTFDCLITEIQDSLAILTYQATGGDGNYTFNGNSQNDTLQNGDIYQIEVTDGNGCTTMVSDTINCEFTSITNSEYPISNIHLFPNPNDGSFTLNIETQHTEMIDIEILDITGRTQAKTRRRLENTATFERHEDLPSGLYFIRLSGKDWTWTEKMVVE